MKSPLFLLIGFLLAASLLSCAAGKSSLHDAVKAGNTAEVERLLKRGTPADERSGGAKDETALMVAAREGNVELARLLIAAGADVNARAREGDWISHSGPTPLGYAVKYGHRDMVRLLLDRKADWNAGSPSWGLLCQAVDMRRADIAELLLAKGVKSDVACKWDSHYVVKPLCLAIELDDRATAKVLLARGASVHRECIEGKPPLTPLFYAAQCGGKEMAELLIAKGAKVNVTDNTYTGATPLHYAAYFGNREVAEVLIAHGADVNAVAWYGMLLSEKRTPLAAAVMGGHRSVAKLLRRHGAKR